MMICDKKTWQMTTNLENNNGEDEQDIVGKMTEMKNWVKRDPGRITKGH